MVNFGKARTVRDYAALEARCTELERELEIVKDAALAAIYLHSSCCELGDAEPLLDDAIVRERAARAKGGGEVMIDDDEKLLGPIKEGDMVYVPVKVSGISNDGETVYVEFQNYSNGEAHWDRFDISEVKRGE